MYLYGFHIGETGDNKIIEEKIKDAKQKGANIVQLFVDTQKQLSEYIEIKQILEKNKMKAVVHGSYMLNLAKNWDLTSDLYSSTSVFLEEFIKEIKCADALGAFGIVIHMGKQLELTASHALNNMYFSLVHAHNKTKDCNTKIIIETSTGQGSEMCYLLEDFAYFYKRLLHEKFNNRFKICIDSCHIFQAGYSIKNYLKEFEKQIGLKHVALAHLNDSKNKIGYKVDRHENIGKGYIKKDDLIYFVKIFKNFNCPIILETPDEKYYKKELEFIRKEK